MAICRNGHDKNVTGKTKDGHCKVCKKNCVIRHPIKKREGNWKHAGILNREGQSFNCLDYDIEYQKQSGRCLVCNLHQSQVPKTFAVDHDHKTGLFRGLVCNWPCNNLILTVAENYPHLYPNAIKYIQELSHGV